LKKLKKITVLLIINHKPPLPCGEWWFNYLEIIMNINKITTELYNWDAGINVSKSETIKFANELLALCNGEEDCKVPTVNIDTIKSCKDNDNIINILELDVINNIKDGNLKYKFIDQLESYDDALKYAVDDWRIPANVDILNIREKLYNILGDKLFTFSLWSYVSAPYIGYRTSVAFSKTNDTIHYNITRNPEKYNKVILVRDIL